MSTATAGPGARFTDLLAAEWIKLRSLRSIPWFLLAATLTIVGMNANGARTSRAEFGSWTLQQQAYYAKFGALHDAFTRPCATLVLLMMGALGAIAILSEQTTGLLRTSLAAVPARRELLAAKVVVVAAVSGGFGVLTASVSFWLDEAILAGRYGGVSIGDPGALRLLAASALLAPLGALVGLALGAVIRHSVTAMVAMFAVLFLIPMFVHDDTHLGAVVAHTQPFEAWARLGLVGEITGVRFPSSLGGAWTVYPVWAAVAVLLVMTAVPNRDQ
ncbi:ABC transporter permease subunit [Kitasatospora sp. NPDC092948]|uniref:ABC transporter permease subunit n=1 Tax=Kitasatospora sp. NPDC092948 TaxID=3364088 RepID=UPI00382E22D4